MAVALIAAVPSGASGATTTIGQLAPPDPPEACANPNPFDHLTASVTSGRSYVVPADGTITSWSHNASSDPDGQSLTFKIFRKLAGENEYRAIAHDGPRDLTEGALNTFNVSIPVKAGDFIGFNDLVVGTACSFSVPGEDGHRVREGDLADGESGFFDTVPPEFRSNLSAVLTTPSPLPPLATTCKGEPATHTGTPGNDVLRGTNGPDVIVGLGGDDKLKGFGGNDLLCGGDGADIVKGANGADRIFGEDGHDRLFGGAGKNALRGGSGKDEIYGGNNSDDLTGNGGNDKLGGGGDNDILRGNKGNDKLFGQGGTDLCKGGAKADKAKTCEVEKSV